jgi:hypothetical protein
MQNTSLVDITNKIKVIDLDYYIKTGGGRKISNPDFLDAKFYELDIMKLGNTTIEFMNTISLYTFKKYTFCKRRLYFDQDKSNLKLINKNLTCDTLGENIGSNTYIDCGNFKDYYKICVDKSYDKFNQRESNNDLSKLTDLDFCPLTDFVMNFIDNPNFKNNTETNPYLSIYSYTKNNTVYTFKTNSTTLFPYLDSINEYDSYGFNQYLMASKDNPKNLILKFEESISFNDFYDLENNTALYNSTDFIYSDLKNLRNYVVGEKYGFRDSFTHIIGRQGFYSFYNSSNYLGKVEYTENNTQYTSYLPFAMNSPDSRRHYSPKIQSPEEEEKIAVNIALYEVRAFSIYCFENVFEKNGHSDVFNFLNQIRLDFLHEVYPTLLAWFFIVLFIQFWGFIKIRVSYLLDILNFRVNQADIETEKITKYTLKFFMFLAFIIIYKGLSFEKSSIDIIIKNADLLIKYKCYDQNISENFKIIEEVSHLIDVPFSKVRLIFYFLIFTECINIANYIINNKNDFKPLDKDKYLAKKNVKIE